MTKELRNILKAVEAQGFTVKRTSKGHWLVRDREGRVVTTISGTPSDRKSWPNSLARMKRAGFVWPPKR